MTPQEARLWLRLRQLKRAGHHFRRQTPIGGFIVDFACYGSRLVVELDGGQHAEARHLSADAERDTRLRALGFRVMRFWNGEINTHLDAVVDAIVAACERR